ncbi:MAG: DUF423 domain-containing protein [Saprospiraceae bacterium]|nr:DUF423 domain-containing protein [Saprospiraceae bacterium]
MKKLKERIIISTAILGILGVIIGAFGAHGLKPHLEAVGRLNAFETGVEYHFYHTLGMGLLAALCTNRQQDKFLVWAMRCFIIGILFFSGSLYLLSCRDLIGANLLWLGPITPIGGLFFIVGWLMLLIFAMKDLKTEEG